MDEAAYRRGIRDRDAAAWERLEGEFHATLCRQASLILPARLDPENAVGDVWLRALEAASTYDPSRPPFPWLSRICLRTCLNQRRGLLRSLARVARSVVDPAPRDELLAEEARDGLRRALQRLPRHERDVVTLRFLFELPTGEIALLLSRNAGSVRSTLVRGIARLRTQAHSRVLDATFVGVGEPGESL
jgi:RNA polymerase sigma factor (sigma-70 family)